MGQHERAIWSDVHGAVAEVGARQLPHPAESSAIPVRAWDAVPSEAERNEPRAAQGPVGHELDMEDAAQAESTGDLEGAAVSDEVAERVGDEAPVIKLHASHDVWARADHEIRALVDGEMRDRP